MAAGQDALSVPHAATGMHSCNVAVLGPPNTGKSTFFNRLTGASARVANWPGMTVEVLTARALLGGSMVRLADLPGIYSLDGHSDDEALARSLHGGFRQFLKRVDFENPFHLRKQTTEQMEVAASDADNGRDGLLVQRVLREMHAGRRPPLIQ